MFGLRLDVAAAGLRSHRSFGYSGDDWCAGYDGNVSSALHGFSFGGGVGAKVFVPASDNPVWMVTMWWQDALLISPTFTWRLSCLQQ